MLVSSLLTDLEEDQSRDTTGSELAEFETLVSRKPGLTRSGRRAFIMSDSESPAPTQRRSQRERKSFKPFTSRKLYRFPKATGPLMVLQLIPQTTNENARKATLRMWDQAKKTNNQITSRMRMRMRRMKRTLRHPNPSQKPLARSTQGALQRSRNRAPPKARPLRSQKLQVVNLGKPRSGTTRLTPPKSQRIPR